MTSPSPPKSRKKNLLQAGLACKFNIALHVSWVLESMMELIASQEILHKHRGARTGTGSGNFCASAACTHCSIASNHPPSRHGGNPPPPPLFPPPPCYPLDGSTCLSAFWLGMS